MAGTVRYLGHVMAGTVRYSGHVMAGTVRYLGHAMAGTVRNLLSNVELVGRPRKHGSQVCSDTQNMLCQVSSGIYRPAWSEWDGPRNMIVRYGQVFTVQHGVSGMAPGT